MPFLRKACDWLCWDGDVLSLMSLTGEGSQTSVSPYVTPAVDDKVAQICALAPGMLLKVTISR